MHHIRGIISTDEAGTQYGDLAEACVVSVWPVVLSHFEKRHGSFSSGEAVILAMGSMAVGRLSSSSDLDLLVIYDADISDVSEISDV